MKQLEFTVLDNAAIAEKTFRMKLLGDSSAILRPGQFVNIRLPGFYLRRPLGVAGWDGGGFEVIYRIAGDGTRALSEIPPGTKLDILTGLGNGFDMDAAAGKKIVIVSGGSGLPPLLGLAKRLCSRGENVTAMLGFGNASAVFGMEELRSFGAEVLLATDDGSAGLKGLVTDLMKAADFDYYFACGPEPMLRAVHACQRDGQLSFERRMGCGFGVCMGCSCKTITENGEGGSKRICLEGPVLYSREVVFDG